MAFDAMWSMAQMLNYTEKMRLSQLSRNHSDFDDCRHLDGKLVPLNEFNYTNAFMGCVMRDNYYKINFTGVSVSTFVILNLLARSYSQTSVIRAAWDQQVPVCVKMPITLNTVYTEETDPLTF